MSEVRNKIKSHTIVRPSMAVFWTPQKNIRYLLYIYVRFSFACTKSGIWQLLSILLMCLSLWFCHLIRDFPFWIFLGVQYFCDFTFHNIYWRWSFNILSAWRSLFRISKKRNSYLSLSNLSHRNKNKDVFFN